MDRQSILRVSLNFSDTNLMENMKKHSGECKNKNFQHTHTHRHHIYMYESVQFIFCVIKKQIIQIIK